MLGNLCHKVSTHVSLCIMGERPFLKAHRKQDSSFALLATNAATSMMHHLLALTCIAHGAHLGAPDEG